MWCRGPESNWLRPPFQGGALPMSYPGFIELFNFRDDSQHCQFGLWGLVGWDGKCVSSRWTV